MSTQGSCLLNSIPCHIVPGKPAPSPSQSLTHWRLGRPGDLFAASVLLLLPLYVVHFSPRVVFTGCSSFLSCFLLPLFSSIINVFALRVQRHWPWHSGLRIWANSLHDGVRVVVTCAMWPCANPPLNHRFANSPPSKFSWELRETPRYLITSIPEHTPRSLLVARTLPGAKGIATRITTHSPHVAY